MQIYFLYARLHVRRPMWLSWLKAWYDRCRLKKKLRVIETKNASPPLFAWKNSLRLIFLIFGILTVFKCFDIWYVHRYFSWRKVFHDKVANIDFFPKYIIYLLCLNIIYIDWWFFRLKLTLRRGRWKISCLMICPSSMFAGGGRVILRYRFLFSVVYVCWLTSLRWNLADIIHFNQVLLICPQLKWVGAGEVRHYVGRC